MGSELQEHVRFVVRLVAALLRTPLVFPESGKNNRAGGGYREHNNPNGMEKPRHSTFFY